jgi:hypothetical protein
MNRRKQQTERVWNDVNGPVYRRTYDVADERKGDRRAYDPCVPTRDGGQPRTSGGLPCDSAAGGPEDRGEETPVTTRQGASTTASADQAATVERVKALAGPGEGEK